MKKFKTTMIVGVVGALLVAGQSLVFAGEVENGLIQMMTKSQNTTEAQSTTEARAEDLQNDDTLDNLSVAVTASSAAATVVDKAVLTPTSTGDQELVTPEQQRELCERGQKNPDCLQEEDCEFGEGNGNKQNGRQRRCGRN